MSKISAILKARKSQLKNKKDGKINKKSSETSNSTGVHKNSGAKKGLQNEVKQFLDKSQNETPESENEDMTMDDFLNGDFEDSAVTEPTTLQKNKNPSPKDQETEKGVSKSKKNRKEKVTQEQEESSSSDEEEADAEQYQEQLDSLKEKDPDFYNYLKKNDSDLLDFNADAVLQEDETEGGKRSSVGKTEITMDMLSKWRDHLNNQKSLTTLQKVIQAFKAAAYLNEDEGMNLKYSITDSRVFNDLLLLAIQAVPRVLNHHVPVQTEKSGRKIVNTDNKILSRLSPMLKSYGFSILRFLEGMTDAKNISLLLRETQNVLPYMITYRKFLKQFVEAVVEVWSTNRDDSVRVSCVLVLRSICLTADLTLLEFVFKHMYLTMIRICSYTTVHTLAAINFMKNSSADLFLLNPESCYLVTFRYIRQLAITLRNTIHQPKPETRKLVQSWSYVHAIDFWSRLLSRATWLSREKGIAVEMQSLVYPLVQIALGAMMISPSSQLYPMRFHVLRSLIYLSRHTGLFIPMAPVLFDVLDSPELSRKPKPSTLKPLDFEVEIRAPTAYLRTRVYQDGITNQMLELLGEYYVLYATSIAFPEFVIPVIVRAKRFAKKSKNVKLNRSLLILVQKLEQQTEFVLTHRAKQKFSPANLDSVETFLANEEWDKTPLGAYVVVQREIREEQRRLLREAILEDQNHKEDMRQKKKGALKNDDDELNSLSDEELE
ncbi:noc complex subunit Noc2 family protein [Schizosaccharomyces cryophilus OY26]|uniref:Noc complex subunit Noc2 family protein n=1 Tax=Schizosaccharomyces cryophilus (strain OY26 / ATCC MYA-4695 / CBS 11777 / NBRC 106824 / NRRL Y48691) TaxID=653667 RepID=S9W2P7_SCHCR|nr:noc complex subunit Noc2 family protein [Schizosaccharomyces cryophilus OY26]EPY52794.1 noc complex subunit Noc2 family protein [Schizosaccharomyces cryophilus OY26]